MARKKKPEEKIPTKTKIFIPPSTQRKETPGFRGCTIDADSADKILYPGSGFKLSAHNEVAKIVAAEVPVPPYVSVSGEVLFKTETAAVVFDNVYFSFSDPRHRILDINLDKLRRMCIFSTVVFRNCRFSDISGTCGNLMFVTHFGTIERVIFEDCSFDDDTKFIIDKGVTVALVRCNASHSILTCTSFSTAVPENSLIVYDTISGDIHTDCVDHVIVDGHASDKYKDNTHGICLYVVKTKCVSIFNNFGKDNGIFVCKCHGSVELTRAYAKRLSIVDSITSLKLSMSEVMTARLDDTVITSLYAPATKFDTIATNGVLCKEIGHEPESVEMVAAVCSRGLPETPITLYKKANYVAYSVFGHSVTGCAQVIVVLEVPASATKHYDTDNHKIRVSEAKVVKILDIEGKPMKLAYKHSVMSKHDSSFTYEIGKTVKPTEPFADSDQTCASGIHGFLDIEDAINY
jgi:hypothetical protein